MRSVSVVIPTFNGKDLLGKNLPPLPAAAGASPAPVEILVVDDGSRDGTVEFLRERFPGVRIKAEILEKVWNLNPETETRAVDNFVMRLRRHLEEDARSPRHLQTVRGVGYRLAEE